MIWKTQKRCALILIDALKSSKVNQEPRNGLLFVLLYLPYVNIAIIIRRLNVKGGAQRQALSLARELTHMGHKVCLYTFWYNKEKCFSDLLEGLTVVSGNELDPKALANRIDRTTDILNPHDQEAYKVAYYFKKAVKNAPSIWMMNDVPSKDFGFWKESQFNPDLRRSFAKAVYHKLYDLRDSQFIAAQEKIAVLDIWNKDLVKTHYNKEAVVVRSGLDIEKFPYHERALPKNKSIKLLCAGIFFPHRRFEDAITAVSLLQKSGFDASLTIAGDYDNDKNYHAKLARWAHSLRLGNKVSFMGKISDTDLKAAYRSHDVFVFPNHLQTWGLAVFEAMSSGIPVVLSRTTGAAEVLTDKENVLLVNPKTPEEIKSAVIELVGSENRYRALAQNARKFVEENISWRKYAERMLEVFNRARY